VAECARELAWGWSTHTGNAAPTAHSHPKSSDSPVESPLSGQAQCEHIGANTPATDFDFAALLKGNRHAKCFSRRISHLLQPDPAWLGPEYLGQRRGTAHKSKARALYLNHVFSEQPTISR